MLGDLHRERDKLLGDWWESCDTFHFTVYHKTIETVTSQVTAIVKGENKSPVINVGNELTPELSLSIDAKPGAESVRFSQKWKPNGELVEMHQALKTIATPIPVLTESLTPRRETKQSVASGDLSWRDRVRSFSPSKNNTSIPNEISFWNPVHQSPSMIPKPPRLAAPSEDDAAMEDQSEEAEKEDDKPTEEEPPIQEESTERVSISDKVEPVAKTQAETKIPALERAAMAKEQQDKQEQARKNRKVKLRKKLKKDKTQLQSPAKVAEKPDELHCGVKRPSELDSSVNKRQKTEATNNRNKKNKVLFLSTESCFCQICARLLGRLEVSRLLRCQDPLKAMDLLKTYPVLNMTSLQWVCFIQTTIRSSIDVINTFLPGLRPEPLRRG